MHYCSLSSYHCVVLFWDTDRARMVFLGYFPCNKHFGNLGTVTVNSRYQQTVLKGLTRYFEDEREKGWFVPSACGCNLNVILFCDFSFPRQKICFWPWNLSGISQWNNSWPWIFSIFQKSLNRDGNFAKEICDSNKLVVIQTLLCISLQNSAP